VSSSLPVSTSGHRVHDGERLLSREFLTLGVATMLYFFGMGATNPLMPKFVVDELGGTEATAGFVMGTFAIAALLTRVFFGRLGDRRGARRLMVIGCITSAAGLGLLLVTDTVALAVASRLLMGTAQAAAMTGSTVLAIDLAPESRRGEAASYILVSFHLGLGIGPVIGEAILNASSYDVVWATLGAFALVGAGVSMLLPHRPGDGDGPPSPWIHPKGIAPGGVAALGIVGFVTFSTFVPLYAETVGLERIGLVFTVASLSIAAVRIAFATLPDRLGPIRACSLALAFSAAGSGIVALWGAQAGVFVAAAVLAGGMALQTPSLIPVAVDGIEPRERSSAMATFTMLMDVSVALTAPLIGLIVHGVGYRTAFLVSGATSLLALGVLYGVLAPAWRTRDQVALASSASS
jgi:MFS family permease